MKLNLGCADRIIEGFIGVDIPGSGAEQGVDLAGPWPWPDSSVDEVMALDVCEHIHDSAQLHHVHNVDRYLEGGNVRSDAYGKFRWVSGRIWFMNELHRVLVPGGRVTIETPNAAKGCGYIQDPTHVSPWCLSSFKYFQDGAFARERLGKLYGITARFRVVGEIEEYLTHGEDAREQAWKIRAVLEAVK